MRPTARGKRRGSKTVKARTAQGPRKIKSVPMNVNAGFKSLRRSTREKKSVTPYDPSSTVRNTYKSTRARTARRTAARTVTTKKNLNNLANLMESTNFNLGHSRNAPPSTRWPPSGRD